MNILLVTENKEKMKLLKQFVEACYPNNRTVAASNVREALQLLKTEQPIRMCFTEVMMQESSGFKVVEELRRYNRYAKAVLIAQDDRFALEGWKAGMNDYLIEPLTIESVQHTLVSCADN